MPPKVDINYLIAKRGNYTSSLYELFEEFNMLLQTNAPVPTLQNVYKEIEAKIELSNNNKKLLQNGFSREKGILKTTKKFSKTQKRAEIK